MVHVAAQQWLRNHEKVASLLAVFVLRTSAVQRSVELRGRGGVEPRSDSQARQPTVADPLGGQPPPWLFWPTLQPEPAGPSVQEAVTSPMSNPVPCGGLVVPQHDMEQPIASVKPAGGDRYCHFASTAPWVEECHAARKDKDYVAYANRRGKAFLKVDAPGESPFSDGGYMPGGLAGPTAFRYASGTRRVVTQPQSWQLVKRFQWPLDDVYCDALGWMDTPSRILYNYTALEELAHWECDKLLLEHPEFEMTTMNEMVDLMHKNNNAILKSVRLQGPGPDMMNLKRQALSKCLLGGLACDIANCGLNFCKLDNLDVNYVGHGFTQCGKTKLVD